MKVTPRLRTIDKIEAFFKETRADILETVHTELNRLKQLEPSEEIKTLIRKLDAMIYVFSPEGQAVIAALIDAGIIGKETSGEKISELLFGTDVRTGANLIGRSN